MTGPVLVTGAGGFIGHHLVRRLAGEGREVRGVDLQEPEFGSSSAEEFLFLDLREEGNCRRAVEGVEEVYHLAASATDWDPPSAGDARRCRTDSLMTLHVLEAAAAADVERLLLASSSAVYPPADEEGAAAEAGEGRPDLQSEEAAWPAAPGSGQGLAKLYAEELCRFYRRDLGLQTRVARIQNVYGPEGPYWGGQAPLPTAVCRKVARAGRGGTVGLWAGGKSSQAHLYVDDCVEGLLRVMASDHPGPLNLAGGPRVTAERLVEIASEAAGKEVGAERRLPGPSSGPGRVLDTGRLQAATGWEPRVDLEEGMARTFRWVEAQVRDLPPDRHPGPPHIP